MKTALVLEGGANRAYFSIGAMDALMENNIKSDYVIGSSAGIANGISYVTGQKGRNLEIGLKYLHDKRYMGFKHLLRPSNRSYYNLKFVFEDLPKTYVPFDYDAFEKYEGNVKAAVTDIKTGDVHYLEVPRDESMHKTIIASCALPIMFQPVEIDGHLFLDGGMTDSIPYKKAIEDGCDKIIIILTREREYVKGEESLKGFINFSYKKYPKLLEAIKNRPDMYNRTRNEIFELEKQGKVFVIMPEYTGDFSRIESDPDKIYTIYKQGYDIACNRMEDLKKYLELS